MAEHEIGVSADTSQQAYLGITFAPGYSYPMPGIPESLVDKLVAAAMPNFKVTGVGLDNIKWAVAPTPAARNSQPYQNRRVCAGNTNCIPICPIQAKYDPTRDARRSAAHRQCGDQVQHRRLAGGGRRQRQSQRHRFHHLRQGPRTANRRTGRVTAKIYILAGNAIENPRLLMMSKNGGRTPRGVANSSGNVGQHLMDHPLYLAWALAPNPVWGYRGPLATAGIEVCRDGEFRRERGAFRIEIGNEGWNFAIGDPNTTTVDLINGLNFSGLNPGTPATDAALFGDAAGEETERHTVAPVPPRLPDRAVARRQQHGDAYPTSHRPSRPAAAADQLRSVRLHQAGHRRRQGDGERHVQGHGRDRVHDACRRRTTRPRSNGRASA